MVGDSRLGEVELADLGEKERTEPCRWKGSDGRVLTIRGVVGLAERMRLGGQTVKSAHAAAAARGRARPEPRGSLAVFFEPFSGQGCGAVSGDQVEVRQVLLMPVIVT